MSSLSIKSSKTDVLLIEHGSEDIIPQTDLKETSTELDSEKNVEETKNEEVIASKSEIADVPEIEEEVQTPSRENKFIFLTNLELL